MYLSDEQFDKRCDLLGTAIRCPLEIGFRSRLRNKTTAPQPAPAHSQYVYSSGSPLVSSGLSVLTAAAQPSTQPAGSYISLSEHVRVALPPAVMGDAATPHCSKQPDTRTSHPAEVAAQPTAASAQPFKSTTTAKTVPAAAAEVAGETRATTT